MNEGVAPSDRTRVTRTPEHGRYEREVVHAILDAGYVCHVAYVFNGDPYVTPTAYWRDGEHVYWHGAAASRMLRTLRHGVSACLTVTHLDGLVLARSAFHHSMNYRSVMVLGTAELVTDDFEKLAALRAFMERLARGRWDEVRQPSTRELKATLVLRMPLHEASAKIRSGPPIDDDADYAAPQWAGVIPIETTLGKPQADPRLDAATPLPPALR